MTHVSQRPVRIGVQIKPQHADYAQIRRACAAAEEKPGVNIVSNWDHFQPLGRGPKAEGKLARVLDDARCLGRDHQPGRVPGPLVSAIGYLATDLLADMARTVDHISGGQLVLRGRRGLPGEGVRRVRLPLGHARRAGRELEAGLARIGRRLAVLNPPPVRKIPILVAGAGERKTLGLVARYGDIWNRAAPGRRNLPAQVAPA